MLLSSEGLFSVCAPSKSAGRAGCRLQPQPAVTQHVRNFSTHRCKAIHHHSLQTTPLGVYAISCVDPHADKLTNESMFCQDRFSYKCSPPSSCLPQLPPSCSSHSSSVLLHPHTDAWQLRLSIAHRICCMLEVHSMKLQSCSQKANCRLLPLAWHPGGPQQQHAAMQQAEEAAGCPFDGNSGAALHPQQVGICVTTLLRLTALPLPGKPLGATTMLPMRGPDLPKSELSPRPAAQHSGPAEGALQDTFLHELSTYTVQAYMSTTSCGSSWRAGPAAAARTLTTPPPLARTSGMTVMPRFRSTASPLRVQGPLAASTTYLQSIWRATSAVMLRAAAAGTNTSQGMVNSCSRGSFSPAGSGTLFAGRPGRNQLVGCRLSRANFACKRTQAAVGSALGAWTAQRPARPQLHNTWGMMERSWHPIGRRVQEATGVYPAVGSMQD